MANQQQKDDTIGYYLGLVMFSIAIPIIAGVGYWMALQLPEDRTTLQAAPAAAAPAAPAADEAPAEEPAAEDEAAAEGEAAH